MHGQHDTGWQPARELPQLRRQISFRPFTQDLSASARTRDSRSLNSAKAWFFALVAAQKPLVVAIHQLLQAMVGFGRKPQFPDRLDPIHRRGDDGTHSVDSRRAACLCQISVGARGDW